MSHTHADPAVWKHFAETAAAAEDIRLRSAAIANKPDFPAPLKVSAGMLAYHLRQVHNIAEQLAGEMPKEVKGTGA